MRRYGSAALTDEKLHFDGCTTGFPEQSIGCTVAIFQSVTHRAHGRFGELHHRVRIELTEMPAQTEMRQQPTYPNDVSVAKLARSSRVVTGSTSEFSAMHFQPSDFHHPVLFSLFRVPEPLADTGVLWFVEHPVPADNQPVATSDYRLHLLESWHCTLLHASVPEPPQPPSVVLLAVHSALPNRLGNAQFFPFDAKRYEPIANNQMHFGDLVPMPIHALSVHPVPLSHV
ncbi:hypothetical protein BQ6471_02898 [Vibrio gazogenes]|nr:hypothetical protein BQ6471_02898 [Vibrio gazogenes]